LYSELNTSIYVNLLYNEGEIHQKFLSFPSVDFPPRMNSLLYRKLEDAEILVGERISDYGIYKKIYTQEAAYKLMKQLGIDFDNTYSELEGKVHEMMYIKRQIDIFRM